MENELINKIVDEIIVNLINDLFKYDEDMIKIPDYFDGYVHLESDVTEIE